MFPVTLESCGSLDLGVSNTCFRNPWSHDGRGPQTCFKVPRNHVGSPIGTPNGSRMKLGVLSFENQGSFGPRSWKSKRCQRYNKHRYHHSNNVNPPTITTTTMKLVPKHCNCLWFYQNNYQHDRLTRMTTITATITPKYPNMFPRPREAYYI
jgi:hypothetical protein